MKTVTLAVRPAEDGVTLQDFLARRLNTSRNRAKALVDARNVLVNGQRVWMARHALAANDRVEVLPERAAPLPARAGHVLYEDDQYLIVDKPAGILSNGPHSLEETLRDQRQQPELTAVHRLDRDTSGCLALAKSRTAFDAAIPVFRSRRVVKTYHALVAGRLQPPEQTIQIPLEGARAVTHVRTLAAGREASHLLVQIETGRTHQIRKHLARLGHPVLGDRQYGSPADVPRRSLELGRQMLHAGSIEFENPFTHTRIHARSHLPSDFRDGLALFRLA